MSRRTVTTDETLATRLQALEEMDYGALQTEWRRLYRSAPPKRVARDLLLLGIAWKLQEQVHGGLGAPAKRRLAELARNLEQDGGVARQRVIQLKPGAKLLREWRGRTHSVIVLEEGFSWQGRKWRSLSAIARQITGGHWSGPRFFGLNGKAMAKPEASVEASSDG